ncbi:MAG: TRAP transporter substrate-binding protein DctP [Desulfobacterales bacterium]|nr:TRAP transporter substrate-binding protein DctP [Desulfobacterales bacterium]
MRKKNMLIYAAIFVLTAVWALPAFSASEPAEKKTLRWAYTMPSKKSFSYGWEMLGPEFEKRTNGRYKVEYYPGETLFKGIAGFDSVLSGVAQIANVSMGQIEKRVPLTSVTLLPVLDFPNSLKGRLAAGNALMEMYRKNPQMQEEFKGLKLFGYHQMNPYILASKSKEIYLPEHFKGLKVGGTGSKMKIISNYGGAEVSQIPPDTYVNMSRGVVDASLLSWSQIWDYKLWEVAKYFYDMSFSGGAQAMVMNAAAWNGMSPEDQKIFTEIWSRTYVAAAEKSYNEATKGPKAVVDSGGKIRKPAAAEMPAWRKAAAPIVEKWIATAKKGKAGDPQAVLAEWQRHIDAFKD